MNRKKTNTESDASPGRQVLKECNKGAIQDDYTWADQKCHRPGIDLSGIFLLGLPGMTQKKVKGTL